MLGSNQLPLPCESSESVTDTPCCVGDSRFFSGTHGSRRSGYSALFGSVLAGLLHRCCTTAEG